MDHWWRTHVLSYLSLQASALGNHFPHICDHLALLGNPEKICSKGYWNPSLDHPHLLKPLKDGMTLDHLIREEMFHYAKKNMALVNVYIKDPVVTRIKRDQKIPLIGFVANTGGLLGLCMGFSLVSAFEIVYHCLISLSERCWDGAKKIQRIQTLRKTQTVSRRANERTQVKTISHIGS